MWKSHLMFVTTIATAGCVNLLAKCEILQLERKKMLFRQCKILHRVLLRINTLSSVGFFASNSSCVKKWKIVGMLKIYNPPIWNIYHPILTLTKMSLTVQLWFHQSVQTHDTIFSLLPFATTPVKSRSTQIKPRIKGQPPCWNSANIQYAWIWWNAAPAQRTQQWGCLPHLHIMRHPRIEIHVEIASNNNYTQESVLCLSIVA